MLLLDCSYSSVKKKKNPKKFQKKYIMRGAKIMTIKNFAKSFLPYQAGKKVICYFIYIFIYPSPSTRPSSFQRVSFIIWQQRLIRSERGDI